MDRITALLLPALLVVTSLGCAAWERGHRYVVDRHRAQIAYREDNAVPRRVIGISHFRRGYLAGYIDVANGGDGTPPLLPPRAYAGEKYRKKKGKSAASDWFNGFQLGALSAEKDGVRDFHFMLASPEVVDVRVEPAGFGTGANIHASTEYRSLDNLPIDAGPSPGLVPPEVPTRRAAVSPLLPPVVSGRGQTTKPPIRRHPE